MKQRINVVVVENEKLQMELRSKAANESLRDYTLKNSMVTRGFTPSQLWLWLQCNLRMTLTG